jgi:hypothetical protein
MATPRERKDFELPLTTRHFWLIAVAVVAVIGAAIWFSIPGPDTRHDLRSPSGSVLLQIAEDCQGNVCRRVIIHEADGVRTGCSVRIPGPEPVFVTVTADWRGDESGATLQYADGDGTRGELPLVFATDCTQRG